MARKRSTEKPKPFEWPDDKTIDTPLVGNKIPPSGATLNEELMRSDDKRDRAAYLLTYLTRDFMECTKVNTDSELIARIDEYFSESARRRITPTVEGLCLYCGYSSGKWAAWCSGIDELKHDVPNVSTQMVAQKAKTLLASYDGTLAVEGQVNTIAYIFRARNYYDMRNEDVVTLNVQTQQATLPREEIVKRIADITADIDSNYEIK